MSIHHVIIGAGPAAINAVETIRQFDRDSSRITMISDEPAHARELVGFLAGLDAPVYLIPHNPGDYSPYRAPTPAAVTAFVDELRAARRKVRLRATRGDRIRAGCGQLATR